MACGPMDLYRWLPPEGVKIVLVLALSFLIGLEREEHKTGAEPYSFGGVRTFPLIGLIGYALALLSGAQLLPVALGFAVVAGFLMLSYRHKLTGLGIAGVTSEMSGLTTYLVGVLVSHEQFWIAATISVASMLLLELKGALEGLTKRISGEEILTFTKFLLLTAVVLPVLPNQEFGPFRINPYRTWLIVVAVSTVSYASYVIQRWTKQQGGLILAAILGGAYSSTVATVVLARRARRENHPHLFSGVTLIASGMMYLRLAALLGLFSRSLLLRLGLPFGVLACVAIGAGWLWSRRPDPNPSEVGREYEPKNPLEVRAALLFGLLFLADVSCHSPGGGLPGKGGRVRPGGADGGFRRRSVHHGDDPGGRIDDPDIGGRRRNRDCRLQQQPGERSVRIWFVRPQDRSPEFRAIGRAGACRARALVWLA